MRALVIAVAVLMSAAASAQSQDLRRPPPPGQPTGPITQPAPDSFRYEGTLVVVEKERMEAQLARMEEMLKRALERTDRGPGRSAMLKLGDELDSVRRTLRNAQDVHRYQQRPPPPPPAPVMQPIREDQLQRLSKAIGNESFGDGKLRVLEAAAGQQYFLVPQVQKLLQRFTFAEDRLNAMRVLWPRVLDRQNAYQLYGAFTFASEKEELRKIIGG
jgi:hypothetical protein